MLVSLGMLVRERMTRHPLTVSPEDSVRRARILMHEGHVRRLPVVDRDRLVGIITAGDIWRRLPAGMPLTDERDGDQLLDHVLVGGVMTLQPRVISPETSLLDAAHLMLEQKISALPVVERGHLVGILTETDILKAMIAKMGTNHGEETVPE
jgi:acetoin utilization protein AcuB